MKRIGVQAGTLEYEQKKVRLIHHLEDCKSLLNELGKLVTFWIQNAFILSLIGESCQVQNVNFSNRMKRD